MLVPRPAVLVAALVLATAAHALDVAEHRARREALARIVGEDSIAVVLTRRPAEPFAQDPDFAYLTGVDEPGGALILAPGRESDAEVLYLMARDRARERWDGATLDPGDIDGATGEPDAARHATMERTGVGAVRARATFEADLRDLLARRRILYLVASPVAAGEPLTPALELWRDLRDRNPGIELRPLRDHLTRLRAVKSPAEMAAIERAVAITIEAHRRVAGDIAPGRREYQVKALLEYVFRRLGGDGPAFPSIVAAGPNATTLHYRGDGREIQAQDLVVVDIGARVRGYAADVTRTYPASGRFSERERQVYDVVLAAQDAALARVKPGAKLRADVHAAAKDHIEKAGFGKHFTHGTSHFVGLEVHDVGNRDAALEPGMVVTVEPGIYLAEEAIGVRIEDMVVVTEKGHRVLTAALPRQAAEIEALVAAERAASAGFAVIERGAGETMSAAAPP